MKDRLEAALAGLIGLRREDQIDDKTYCKHVLLLCHELVKLGDTERAYHVAIGIPPSYFQESVFQQMLDDEKFLEAATSVAQALVAGGYIEDGDPLTFTMPAGVA